MITRSHRLFRHPLWFPALKALRFEDAGLRHITIAGIVSVDRSTSSSFPHKQSLASLLPLRGRDQLSSYSLSDVSSAPPYFYLILLQFLSLSLL